VGHEEAPKRVWDKEKERARKAAYRARKQEPSVASYESGGSAPVPASVTAAPVPDLPDLPEDIASIWTGEEERTARTLIDAWGVDVFRRSAIHRAALNDRERLSKKENAVRLFLASR
jgi:hypothetical protein